MNVRKLSAFVSFGVGSLVLLSGCASTTVVRPGDAFDLGGKSTLRLRDGRSLDVREARLDDDTLRAVRNISRRPVGVPVTSVDRLVQRNVAAGALQGFAIGMAAGHLIRATPAGNCTDQWGWEHDRCNIGGGMMASVLLGLVGLVGATAAEHGVPHTFVFVTAPRLTEEPGMIDGDGLPEGGEAGVPQPTSIAGEAPLSLLPQTTFHSDTDRSVREEVPVVSQNLKRDISPYFMMAFGPAFGTAPSGPSNLAGWSSDNIGLFVSVAGGVVAGEKTMYGTRISAGYMEGAFTEEWYGEATLLEVRMEMLRFVGNGRTYLKSGLGLSRYRYEEFALAPGETGIRNRHSAMGGVGALGAGYAIRISQTLNLLMDGEVSYSRYMDGASSFAIKPSIILAWH